VRSKNSQKFRRARRRGRSADDTTALSLSPIPSPRSRLSQTFSSVQTVKGEYIVDEDFPDRFEAARVGEDAPVILLDSFGKEAPAAAKALAAAGVVGDRKLFFVADGAEGPRGWKASGEAWREPSKGLNFSGLKNVGASLEALASDLQSAPSTAKVGLAAGALLGAGILLFNEVEAVLELAGALAAGQFIAKRLVFAADRKQTAAELDALVREVAPADLGADLAKVGSKLLEDPGPRSASASSSSSSSAAPAASSSSPAPGSLGSREPPASSSPSTPAPAAAAAAEKASAAAAAGGASEAREWIAAWRESNK
jgi:chitinase domain-containing protein 1